MAKAGVAAPKVLSRKFSITMDEAEAVLDQLDERGLVGPRRQRGQSREVLT